MCSPLRKRGSICMGSRKRGRDAKWATTPSSDATPTMRWRERSPSARSSPPNSTWTASDMSDAPLLQSDLKSLPFLHRGKVRDIYAVGDDKLLIVQSDRLSAFDVILPTPIPGKGRVLTELSLFWFDKLSHVVPNHLTGIAPESVVAQAERDQIAGRAMVVRKLKPLLVEAVVRGYIIGSGWKDYQETGAICGIRLPPNMQQAKKLPQPIFTPASKAPAGEHDENITFDDAVSAVGGHALAERVRDI